MSGRTPYMKHGDPDRSDDRHVDVAARPALEGADPGNSQNCLVEKLSHYVDLDALETDALRELQSSDRSFGKDETVFSTMDENQDLYIVQQGWLFNYIDTPDGRRQIVNIYLPGDVIGFPDVALPERTTNLYAVEKGSLCPFPKNGLGSIFKNCPRLAALLLTIALREQTVLIDRLRIFSRMSARARVGYLFLELNARVRLGAASTEGSYHMPLNQQEIGDMVGLTNVSVSRAVTAMEEAGLLRVENKTVNLIDISALTRLCDFRNRYATMQTDWLP
ncbi:Crp/Fnr family transcriptional regulator [uncultured Algimonas sp.]|uniref:Crp/Fnr family transcriptional regulator n=1 Tax=uncultured Algimonas sp. TaxID=1547920 RepID=UPI00260F1D66|nr:Crp/Fnr family transcriptional regulator [uncultured Algimonas sp.]